MNRQQLPDVNYLISSLSNPIGHIQSIIDELRHHKAHSFASKLEKRMTELEETQREIKHIIHGVD